MTLAVVCGVVFVAFFVWIAEMGPARTFITFVNPAVAVVLGSLLLYERVTVATVAALRSLSADAGWRRGRRGR
jgi:hypothetical protein